MEQAIDILIAKAIEIIKRRREENNEESTKEVKKAS